MANVSNTTSTTTSTAAVDELAKTVEGALVGVIGTMQKIVTESAAERAADRKKVNEVDEKADLANDKANKNAEELKAIISLLDANTKEIVMLHRNDATREVELKYLKRILNVMIAVVAYMLWWIGHAWSNHARTMHCYNDASIHIICVDEMRVEERVEK